MVTGLAAPADESNLAWRALEAVRAAAPRRGPGGPGAGQADPDGRRPGRGQRRCRRDPGSRPRPASACPPPSGRPWPRPSAPTCPSAWPAGPPGWRGTASGSPRCRRWPASGWRWWCRPSRSPPGPPTPAGTLWKGPQGPAVEGRDLPPQLRPYEPLVQRPGARGPLAGAGPGGLGGRPAAALGAGGADVGERPCPCSPSSPPPPRPRAPPPSPAPGGPGPAARCRRAGRCPPVHCPDPLMGGGVIGSTRGFGPRRMGSSPIPPAQIDHGRST